jgi:hypothetical protein
VPKERVITWKRGQKVYFDFVKLRINFAFYQPDAKGKLTLGGRWPLDLFGKNIEVLVNAADG